jgi:thiamine biosynthesis lipoprotein
MKKFELVEKKFKALGTDIYLQLVSEDVLMEKAKKDLVGAENFYLTAEKIFSRFDEGSELSHFNANLGKFWETSPHFLSVAEKILDYHSISRGLFDPRVIEVLEQVGYEKDFKRMELFVPDLPGKNIQRESHIDLDKDLIIQGEEVKFNQRMDFAGIAKGYITDTAGEMLKKSGWKNFLLDSGGDMLASGKDQEGDDWRIDIEGIPEEKILLILKDEAIATSGIGKRKWQRGGKRFHHLINPKYPDNFSFDLQSVTVISKTVTEADFWAKVLFLSGKEDGKKLTSKKNLKSIFLDYRGNAWVSPQMKNNL